MVLMIISGLICFIFPRFPSYIILAVSGLIGFIYAVITNVFDLAIFIILINMTVSSIPIVMVKYAFYLHRKANEME